MYAEGRELEDALISRNSDVNRLLQKIDSLVQSDEMKSSNCGSFVADLKESSRFLLHEIDNVKNLTRQDVQSLIDSNDNLVAQTKESCSKVQSTVTNCLEKIQLDTDAASSTIASLQGDVKEQLQSLLSNIKSSLQELQETSLSPLYKVLYERIDHSESLIATQQSQLEGISAQLRENFAAMAAKGDAYVQQQEIQKFAIEQAANGIKDYLSKQMEHQKTHTANFAADAKKAMKAKAAAIEQVRNQFFLLANSIYVVDFDDLSK